MLFQDMTDGYRAALGFGFLTVIALYGFGLFYRIGKNRGRIEAMDKMSELFDAENDKVKERIKERRNPYV